MTAGREHIRLTSQRAELYRGSAATPTLERAVPLPRFLESLAEATRREGIETPLLPVGTRLWRQRGDHTTVVVEQAPQMRRVQWVNDGERPELAWEAYIERTLAFQYTVFVFSFDQGVLDGRQQLYYRNQPLVSLQDGLLMPNLLNVTVGGDSPACWACLGKPNAEAVSWGERISAAVAGFWSAGFNHDFDVPRGSCFSKLTHLDPRIETVAAWELASLADPLFPLTLPWPPAGMTLVQAVDAAGWERDPEPGPVSLEDLGDLIYRLPEGV
ncbi:MAG: hypothetical protein AAB289_17020 [Chloroflexota bacterium]